MYWKGHNVSVITRYFANVHSKYQTLVIIRATSGSFICQMNVRNGLSLVKLKVFRCGMENVPESPPTCLDLGEESSQPWSRCLESFIPK